MVLMEKKLVKLFTLSGPFGILKGSQQTHTHMHTQPTHLTWTIKNLS